MYSEKLMINERKNHRVNIDGFSMYHKLSHRQVEVKGLTQPISKCSMIKINKTKHPPDFFPKSSSLIKRISNRQGSNRNQQPFSVNSARHKAQSLDHIPNSPDKTSFFGFFDANDTIKMNSYNPSTRTRRKYDSRQNIPKQGQKSKRKLTAFDSVHGSDLLQLFPATHDPQLGQIIVTSNKTTNLKISPRKNSISQVAQNLCDNYSMQKIQPNVVCSNTVSENQLLSVHNDSNATNSSEKYFYEQPSDIQTITFYNAKSISLPPIHKNYA